MTSLLRRLLLMFGAGIAEFERTPQGWVFQASALWVFGARPRYLVDEAQKTNIELLLGTGALVIGISFWALIGVWEALSPSPSNFLFVYVPASLLIATLGYILICYTLRTLLKDVPQTTQKITRSDRLKIQAARHSTAGLLVVLLISFSLLFMILYLATTADNWSASVGATLLIAALPGGFFIYFAALLVLKVRERAVD
jgi:hypothetical protein